MQLEKHYSPLVRPGQALSDFGGEYAVNAFVAFIFAASGPVAIILAVGTRGGLSGSDLSSWIFGAFFINGLISIAFCWLYREPLVFFWTIPGTVLVGPALGHLSFPEVIGAFVATGLLMLVLGLSGWVRRCTDSVRRQRPSAGGPRSDHVRYISRRDKIMREARSADRGTQSCRSRPMRVTCRNP